MEEFNICRVYRVECKECKPCLMFSRCVGSSQKSWTVRVNFFEEAETHCLLSAMALNLKWMVNVWSDAGRPLFYYARPSLHKNLQEKQGKT